MATPHGNEYHIEDERSRRNSDDDENRPTDPGDANEGDGASTHVETILGEKELALFLQSQMDEDEGCVVEISDLIEARTFGQYPLTEDHLPPASKLKRGGLPNDSGFSSRMSEDSASLHREVEVSDLKKAVAEAAHDDFAGKSNDAECCRPKAVFRALVKLVGVLLLLYVFICSLDLLSNAFRLLGGKTAGSVFQDSELLQNPITGLMIGVIATVILQSSSTSTSIIITMVSSGILDVRPGIPIVMGANIGTTVTNTLVSLAHSMDPREFRRAFSGATVHDVFNWLTVLILLPIEYFSGYLYHLSKKIVEGLNMEELRTKKQDLLKKLTKPLTKSVVLVDKKVITAVAQGKADPDSTLLKVYCTFNKTERVVEVNETLEDGNITLVNKTITDKIPLEKCESLFSMLDLGDSTSGALLFIFSLLLLSGCLFLMVKLLHSLLGSQVARMAKKTINANFPGPFACLTDYVALVVGAGLTILVQSSSVFTSALTPLVGVGCLKLERMYPLTLGSNIGTTATGILAALASSAATMPFALQLALCHLFFNITGILLFFPIPTLRRFPLRVARFLGRTTAHYRWFALFYLLMMFMVFPSCFLALSFAGGPVFISVICLVGLILAMIIAINVMQRNERLRSCLPSALRTWEWLPLCLRSLQPLDNFFHSLCSPLRRACCQCCVQRCQCLSEGNNSEDKEGFEDDSDDEEEEGDGAVMCCCQPSRGVLKVQQSEEQALAVEQGALKGAVVWNKRTPRPIYKPSLKSHHAQHSTSAAPLLRIPESNV